MQAQRPDAAPDRTGLTAIRLTILAYAVAMAAGLVPGTGLVGVTGRLLPEIAAIAFAKATVFALAAAALAGPHARTASLLLAHFLFWSSYLTALDHGMAGSLAQFWRDLALVVSLLLTASGRLSAPDVSRAEGIVGREIPVPAADPAPPLWLTRRRASVPAEPDREIANIFALPA